MQGIGEVFECVFAERVDDQPSPEISLWEGQQIYPRYDAKVIRAAFQSLPQLWIRRRICVDNLSRCQYNLEKLEIQTEESCKSKRHSLACCSEFAHCLSDHPLCSDYLPRLEYYWVLKINAQTRIDNQKRIDLLKQKRLEWLPSKMP